MNEKILADRYKLIEQIGMGGMAIVYRTARICAPVITWP